MPRIVDYCTAPVQKRRVSITDEMADEVREILGRDLNADDVAREFDRDDEVQEVVRELIAEEVEEEPYPGWAMGLGISEIEWSEHYEQVERSMRVKRKFAARKAALSAEYAKKMEKLELQEKRMMPVWSPKSKLIREITALVYRGLEAEEISKLDTLLDDLKTQIKKSQGTVTDTSNMTLSMAVADEKPNLAQMVEHVEIQPSKP